MNMIEMFLFPLGMTFTKPNQTKPNKAKQTTKNFASSKPEYQYDSEKDEVTSQESIPPAFFCTSVSHVSMEKSMNSILQCLLWFEIHLRQHFLMFCAHFTQMWLCVLCEMSFSQNFAKLNTYQNKLGKTVQQGKYKE